MIELHKNLDKLEQLVGQLKLVGQETSVHIAGLVHSKSLKKTGNKPEREDNHDTGKVLKFPF